MELLGIESRFQAFERSICNLERPVRLAAVRFIAERRGGGVVDPEEDLDWRDRVGGGVAGDVLRFRDGRGEGRRDEMGDGGVRDGGESARGGEEGLELVEKDKLRRGEGAGEELGVFAEEGETVERGGCAGLAMRGTAGRRGVWTREVVYDFGAVVRGDGGGVVGGAGVGWVEGFGHDSGR